MDFLASSRASAVGAETVTSAPMPNVTDFCTSSKLQRLVISTNPDAGSVLFCAKAPISLSRAVWRPTSSRTSRISPSCETHAAPCTVRLSRFIGCLPGSVFAALRMALVEGADGARLTGASGRMALAISSTPQSPQPERPSTDRRTRRAGLMAVSSTATSTAMPFSTGMHENASECRRCR